MKKLCSVVFILFIMCAFHLEGKAADKNDLTFELSDDGRSYVVDWCEETATGKLVIPSKYKGLPVTEIGAFAFSSSELLTEISMPDTITHINKFAFSGCYNLERIKLSKNLVYIGESTFSYCNSLESITIPKKVTDICTGVFDNCDNLEKVVLPDKLKTIGVDAFAFCESLEKIVIPDSVTKIGVQAFMYCESLQEIVIPNKVSSISKETFYNCSNLKSISIGKNVKKIGEDAFFGCKNLEDVYLFTKDLPKIADGNLNFIASEWHYIITKTTKATISENGKKSNVCKDCAKVVSDTVIFRPDKITLSNKKYTYDGKNKTPAVTVKDSKGNTLKKDTDYTVTYPKKRKSIGKYTVKVTFKGKYSGTKKITYEIVPAKVTLSKLTAGKKQLAVTWKTVSSVTGYDVVYSTSKDFTKKTTKTITVKNSKTKNKTIKKLTKGKKYYVKIRAYKTIGENTYYGAYSSVKSIKVK